MARNQLLFRQGFAQFLRDSADEVVGKTRDIDECPVATYLAQPNVTNREWHVSTLACVPQVDAEPGEDQFDLHYEFKTPRWAQRFIHDLDRHFGRKPIDVTGAEALYVLEEYARV